jgi:MinD-like ATPase involved in chromosome partitioning or flagellar assembly
LASPDRKLRIVTFYSYKGGTGRSMALANVAWILASNRKKVLVVDWDLEAPGLHRYFHPYLTDRDLVQSTGVIDFVMRYAREAIKPPKKEPDPLWYVPYANLLRHATSLTYPFPEGGTLDFVPSGRQGSDYAARVNSFNWSSFYENQQGGLFLEAAKLSAGGYDYLLIDSRTGVSDTSGICTVQLPDLLVVCFTPNAQSIEGAAAVAASADVQRTRPDRTRTLRIFPVMTRVLQGERRRVDKAREIARRRFDSLMWHVPEGERDLYWGRMSVPQEPFYAFEEVLAVFADEPGLPNTMLASMEALADSIVRAELPQAAISPPLKLPGLDEATRRAELGKFLRLEPEPVQPPLPEPEANRPIELGQIVPSIRIPEGGYKYWFYISYSRNDDSPYLQRFFKDLSDRVRMMTGDNSPAGFFDSNAISSGENWRDSLAAALARIRTFVPILSPAYVMSEFCGKEWEIVRSRQSPERSRSTDGILPVLWTPLAGDVPDAVAAAQWADEALPESYNARGLRNLIQLSKNRADYRTFVEAFAERLVSVGTRSPIPIATELPPLESVRSAFRSGEGHARPAQDTRSVRFVFAVGTFEELTSVREAHFAKVVYGERAGDWHPYSVPLSAEELARTSATYLKMNHEFVAFDKKLIEMARSDSGMVIVVADAWSLLLKENELLLEAVLDVNRPSWSFLWVFDDGPDTKENISKLASAARQLSGPSRRFYSATSNVELEETLRVMIETLRVQMLNRGVVPQPGSVFPPLRDSD